MPKRFLTTMTTKEKAKTYTKPKKSPAEVANDRAIGERIKEIRTDEKLDQREFGRRLGVTNPAVAQWENGTATCTRPYLDKIVAEFKVSRDWLHTGKGTKTMTETVSRMTLLSRARAAQAESFIEHLWLKDQEELATNKMNRISKGTKPPN